MLYRLYASAKLRRHCGHASANEAVEDEIARFCVMQDQPHDGFVRHLGQVRVSVDELIVPAVFQSGWVRKPFVWAVG
ncbi:MAG TPA: hypothetical protein VG013_15495, partial [Gemmataceae bacterium]|nr:hypothetical protein [Gemmataceae bacterium]